MLRPHFECIYCGKGFHFKDLYENHVPTCEYFYRSKKERQRSIEAIETLPSPQDMYRLVQHLTLTCQQLEQKVAKLEQQASQRSRRNIFRELQHSPPPPFTLSQWVNQIPVSADDLTYVFEPFHTLVDGMRRVLQNAIATSGLPVRAFTARPHHLYVYVATEHGDPHWTTCTPATWQYVIDVLARHFLRAFCQWEDLHIPTGAEEKDLHVRYMIRVTGKQAVKDKEKQDLKTWLIQRLGS